MGISATAGAKAFSHTFSLALTLAILTNLTQYTYWKSSFKRGSLWSRQGPTILLAIATPLLLADLMRHCLQDADLWPAPGSSMYRDDCDDVSGVAGLRCLTLVGWIFSIICTYSGFILMLIAVIWSADLSEKLKNAWKQIYLAPSSADLVGDLEAAVATANGTARGRPHGDGDLLVKHHHHTPGSHTASNGFALQSAELDQVVQSGSNSHAMLHMYQARRRNQPHHKDDTVGYSSEGPAWRRDATPPGVNLVASSDGARV